MEPVELQNVGSAEWAELQAGEHQPWGEEGASLAWADKDRHIGIRAADGRLIALAGTAIVQVSVDGHGSFPVVGLGGVIVTREVRGRGLALPLLKRTMEMAGELGPERAMLFCLPRLMGLYAKYGFLPIEASVSADQPEGRIEMPREAMWRPLRAGVDWPEGAVEVLGLPF